MNPKVISEVSMNMYELKQEMTKIKKRDTELGIRSTKTDDYLNNFASLKISDAAKLKKELSDLNVPRLKEEHINKIIDVLPETADEFKTLMQGYVININKENTKKILELTCKYVQS